MKLFTPLYSSGKVRIPPKLLDFAATVVYFHAHLVFTILKHDNVQYCRQHLQIQSENAVISIMRPTQETTKKISIFALAGTDLLNHFRVGLQNS